MTYEGYGPHGIAVFVDTLTDNTTRTVADVRLYSINLVVTSEQWDHWLSFSTINVCSLSR